MREELLEVTACFVPLLREPVCAPDMDWEGASMAAVRDCARRAIAMGARERARWVVGERLDVEWMDEVEAQLEWYLSLGDEEVRGEMVAHVTSAVFVAGCLDWGAAKCGPSRTVSRSSWMARMDRFGVDWDPRTNFIGSRWRFVVPAGSSDLEELALECGLRVRMDEEHLLLVDAMT